MIRRIYQRFMADQSGSVLMIFGISFLILVGIGGAGYDLGHQQLVRQKLQQATDAAVLAGASMADPATDEERKATARRYFLLNFPDGYFGVSPAPTPTVEIAGTTIRVHTFDTSIETAFVRNLPAGPENLPAKGDSTAELGLSSIPPIDMVLVMDNSLSMSSVDVGSGSTRNVPSGLATETRTAAVAACSTSNSPNGVNFNLAYEDYYAHYTGLGYTQSAAQAAAMSLAVTRSPGEVAKCSAYTDAETCPWVPGVAGCENYGLRGANRLNALRYSANYLASAFLDPNPRTNRIAVVRWSEMLLTDEPFSDQYTIVSRHLDRMFAYGATNSTLGLNAAFSRTSSMRPASSTSRAVVLLTDGKNEVSRNAAVNATVNPASLAVCKKLKEEKDVLIYTVAFGKEVENDATVADFLSKCASGNPATNKDQFFFIAPDAAKLSLVFGGIVTSLQKVRVTK
ncbi:MAG: Tad domain-containing protein [Pseudomonadota bacterium]